jgi:hypothetical protein
LISIRSIFGLNLIGSGCWSHYDDYGCDRICQFADGLVGRGALFGFWLSLNPAGLDANAYAAQQRRAIGALNTIMPVLGGILLMLTIASAVLARPAGVRVAILLGVAVCFAAAGLITRLRNQPINAIVMTWPIESPPNDWMQVRDDWWRWYVLRTVFGIGGLCVLIAAMLERR